MIKKIRKLIGDLFRFIGKFFRKGKNQKQPEESNEKKEDEHIFPY